MELFPFKVLEIVKNHPDGITTVEITEELGGSVDFFTNKDGSSPDNTVFWQVIGIIDSIMMKGKEKKDPPIKRQISGEEKYSKLFKYIPNPDFPGDISLL